METAPRTVISRSGNSRRATSDAEYTDAPDSLTITTSIALDSPIARTNASVSRLAVPLPMAIASMRNWSTRRRMMS